jgi:hypothetical protein
VILQGLAFPEVMMTELKRSSRAYSSFLLLLVLAKSASAITLPRLELIPDGSADPFGDIINFQVYILPGEKIAQFDLCLPWDTSTGCFNKLFCRYHQFAEALTDNGTTSPRVWRQGGPPPEKTCPAHHVGCWFVGLDRAYSSFSSPQDCRA